MEQISSKDQLFQGWTYDDQANQVEQVWSHGQRPFGRQIYGRVVHPTQPPGHEVREKIRERQACEHDYGVGSEECNDNGDPDRLNVLTGRSTAQHIYEPA